MDDNGLAQSESGEGNGMEPISNQISYDTIQLQQQQSQRQEYALKNNAAPNIYNPSQQFNFSMQLNKPENTMQMRPENNFIVDRTTPTSSAISEEVWFVKKSSTLMDSLGI